MSLDGVVQGPGAPSEDTSGGFENGGWVAPFFDECTGRHIDAIYGRSVVYLLGRGTYDIFANYWPHQPNREDSNVARQLNTLPKYVASRGNPNLTWANSQQIRDLKPEVEALKASIVGEIQVHGSPGLLQWLHQLELLDEWNLFIYPVVLGSGKRFIDPGAAAGTMRLVEHEVSRNGIICARYARDGALRVGTIGEKKIETK